MPTTTTRFHRQSCTFCRYYDAHHDPVRCVCAACWRRRTASNHPTALSTASIAVTSQNDEKMVPLLPPRPPCSRTSGAAKTSALAVKSPFPNADYPVAKPTSEAACCPHRGAPFHHCRDCVLPPYHARVKGSWDGHAIVCIPYPIPNKGCGCAVACRCRRSHTHGMDSALAPLPKFEPHELPIMGPLSALYTRDSPPPPTPA